MSRQRVLAATLAWLAVVASVSTLVWVVISRAGDDLISSDQPLATTVEQTAAPPYGTGTSPSPSPARTPSPSRSDDASASPAPTASSVSPASPSTSPTSPTQQPATAATEERRTWQGQAGSIVALCAATGIRLVSAQPANGFRAEAQDGGETLEIEFEGREDRAGTDVKVVVRCAAGVPSFAVETDD